MPDYSRSNSYNGYTNRDESSEYLEVPQFTNYRRKFIWDTIKKIALPFLLLASLIVLIIWVDTYEFPDIGRSLIFGSTEGTTPVTHPEEEDPDEPGQVSEDRITHNFFDGNLELPVIGASGWAAVRLTLRSDASASSENILTLDAGDVFTILDEIEGWWMVRLPDRTVGWVDTRMCFINLPDVLPSIVYDIQNSYSSQFRSSGYLLPGITLHRLYYANSEDSDISVNTRFPEDNYRTPFIVPGMYTMAQALHVVQQMALSNNETLIIYEAFRPRETQRAVAASLNRVLDINDPEFISAVYRAITDSQWSVGDFISQGRSNHQLGAAVDTSIGIVRKKEIFKTGDYSYYRITEHDKVWEPSPIHELSPRAVLPSRNSSAAENIDENIWNMRSYFERAGFRPLSSEWWHFNHSLSISTGSSVGINGGFMTPDIFSEEPYKQSIDEGM